MKFLPLVASALALAGCSAASSQQGMAASAPSLADGAVIMQAEDVVSARRNTFFLSTRAIGQIKVGIEEGGDLGRARSAARMLGFWAGTLPKMFPEGSNTEASRALDTVWSDREGFEAAAASYRTAAFALADAAEAGDRAGARAAFGTLAGTCQACHQAYREE